MEKSDLKLYLVTDRRFLNGRRLVDVVQEAVKGGVTMVQLREKDLDTRSFVEEAIELKNMLKPYGVPLIINDRIDVALASDADGVHIGQNDMEYSIARKLLGKDKIIGLSVENMEQIAEANHLGVDYIGISPVFSTPTKTDTSQPFGLEGLRRAVTLSVHPTVGIGGMNTETIGDVMLCGADGVAVVSAIMASETPLESARLLKRQTVKSWTKQIWPQTEHIFKLITEQPFILELVDGTLQKDKFARYLAQDEIYIGNYGRQMFLLADMIDDEEQRNMFRIFAQSGIDGEKAMHQLLIDRFSIDTDVRASVVTSTYNSHTQRALDSGSKEIAIAAMLPCMWIYNRVGLHILEHAKMEDNPYKEWILEYGNEEFTEGVNSILKLIDEWAEKADETTKAWMSKAYTEAAWLEYAFWDYGYNGDGKDYELDKIQGGVKR